VKLSPVEAEKVIEQLRFEYNSLVHAVTQDSVNNRVLMVAFMNREAVHKTLTTGLVHYWSVNRSKVWMKGEVSGHFQAVEEVYVNCENNALLLLVRQKVGACHMGYKSCFYRRLNSNGFEEVEPKVFDPDEVYA
jgi:phosphoribosyl-AMP cyclohydrolase